MRPLLVAGLAILVVRLSLGAAPPAQGVPPADPDPYAPFCRGSTQLVMGTYELRCRRPCQEGCATMVVVGECGDVKAWDACGGLTPDVPQQ